MQQGVSEWDKGQCSEKCYRLHKKQQDIDQCYAKCLKDHESKLFPYPSQKPTLSENLAAIANSLYDESVKLSLIADEMQLM